MSVVAARFYVQSVTPPADGTSQASQVSLGAVCRGAHNKAWASATPAGQITMTIRNDEASALFEPGQEYEVTFRKVTKPVEGDGHQPVVYRDHGYAVCAECGQYAGGQSVEGRSIANVPDADLDWSGHHEFYGSKP